jgi:hypothetical protein
VIVRETRIAGECQLVQELAILNPDRIQELEQQERGSIQLSLFRSPALGEKPEAGQPPSIVDRHRVRIEFPRYYPSVPCEVFLSRPAFHPNIDPENGFVCLWDKHRVANTVETAIVKLTAVLAWELLNSDAPHIMQPTALDWYRLLPQEERPVPLASPIWKRTVPPLPQDTQRRKRLSL